MTFPPVSGGLPWKCVDQFFEQADLVGSLLCFGMPSEFCMMLARDIHLSDDPERELQNTPFKEIKEYCKEHHLTDQYRQACRFLVEHPYLSDGGIEITRDPFWEPEIRTWLRRCYELIPPICLRQIAGQSHIARCPRCGWPLEWRSSRHAIAICYSELCGSLVKHLHDPQIWEPVVPEAMRTTRGIQFSVVGPEVALVNLAYRLERTYGRPCDLWPEVDSYDLAVPLSGEISCNTSILDAGWHHFITFCTYKAEDAGCSVVKVDPRYTSQVCSASGVVVKKKLSERLHSCECGCELDRDHNAALNIRVLGLNALV